MTADDRLTLILTAVSVGFTIVSALLAIVIRIVVAQTRQTDRIVQLARKVDETSEKVSANQEQTDKRVRYLEENFWRRGRSLGEGESCRQSEWESRGLATP